MPTRSGKEYLVNFSEQKQDEFIDMFGAYLFQSTSLINPDKIIAPRINEDEINESKIINGYQKILDLKRKRNEITEDEDAEVSYLNGSPQERQQIIRSVRAQEQVESFLTKNESNTQKKERRRSIIKRRQENASHAETNGSQTFTTVAEAFKSLIDIDWSTAYPNAKDMATIAAASQFLTTNLNSNSEFAGHFHKFKEKFTADAKEFYKETTLNEMPSIPNALLEIQWKNYIMPNTSFFANTINTALDTIGRYDAVPGREVTIGKFERSEIAKRFASMENYISQNKPGPLFL